VTVAAFYGSNAHQPEGFVTAPVTRGIDAPNPSMKLKPGLTANVTVEIARADDTLKVPTSAGSLTKGSRGRCRSRPGSPMVSPRPYPTVR